MENINKQIKNGIILDGFLSFIIKIIGAVLGFVFSMILSRKFSANGVGVYYMCTSIVTICIILGKFGLDNALIKFTSIYSSEKSGGTIINLKKDSFRFSIIISLVIMSIMFVISPVIARLYDKEELKIPLIIMIFSILPIVLSNIIISMMKGLKRNKTALFLESSLASLLSIILVILFIGIYNIKDINTVIVLYTISCYMVLIIVLYIWKKIECGLGRNISDGYEFRKVVDISRPLLLVASMNYLLSSTDTIMLGFWASEDNIGIYNVAIKITQISSMLLVAINSVLGPRFSVLWHKKEYKSIEKLTKDTTRIMSILGGILVVLLFIFGDVFLGLFGEAFIQGENILKITAIGQFIVLATGPVASLLMMTGHQNVHRNTTVFCGLINIILNFLLIPMLGTIGSALATTISLILKNVFAAIAVYRYLNISII